VCMYLRMHAFMCVCEYACLDVRMCESVHEWFNMVTIEPEVVIKEMDDNRYRNANDP